VLKITKSRNRDVNDGDGDGDKVRFNISLHYLALSLVNIFFSILEEQ